MCHELDHTVVQLPVSALRDNPRNNCVHADFDPMGRDAWLLDDIQRHGVLMPLLVFPDNTINEGHRRKNVARHLKLASVPCIVLQKTDENAAFSSAQLHRQMSLFAKCVLYRERITGLIERSEQAQRGNLQHVSLEGRGDASMSHQEWTQCEEVLGVSRRFLIRGVKLLDRLEEMGQAKDFNERQRAGRVASIFRNRGLKPALRMLDENDQTDDSDSDPDVIQWHTDDGDADAMGPRRRPGRPVKQQGGSTTAVAGKIGARKSSPWVVEAKSLVTQLRRLLSQNKAKTPAAEAALAAIEHEIIEGHKRRAA